MNVTFNYSHARARKARNAQKLNHATRLALSIACVVSLTASAAMVAFSYPLSGLLMGIGLLCLMPVLWFKYDLQDNPGAMSDGDSVALELVLHSEVLGKLKGIEKPEQLWAALVGSWQQRFFTARYGIWNDYFEQGVPKITTNMQELLTHAISISRAHSRDELSVGALLVALVNAIPGSDGDLAALHLDTKELETSVDWIVHTEHIISRLNDKPLFGGIARDWTAGYTPTINQLARNVSAEVEQGGFLHRDLAVHNTAVHEMLQFMSQGKQNVALIGEPGTGRTTTVYSFAQNLLLAKDVPTNLKYHKIYSLNATSLVSRASDKGMLETLMMRVFSEAQKSKSAIIFLDEAHAFFSEGTGSVDLSEVLTQVIEAAHIPIILAMSPTDWQNLGTKNPALTALINVQKIDEPNEQDTMRILEDEALLLESRHHVTFTYQALKEAYRLAERYQHEMAFPGRALKVMEGSVNHAVDHIVSDASVQASLEATTGVKLQQTTQAESTELLNLEEQIHTRMINQVRAVKVVSDALRRARSGVNNPNKPIGTFLFLGPTGVGKTELAKAVAATYFKSEDQMVRIDMNEFTLETDATRLLDMNNSNGLLAQISRQPFSVVLFDEIEKAHPKIVDIFLQLLDEGIMRDSNNKQVSFRDAVVIATSNAGADKIRAYIDAGKEVSEFEQPFINELIEGNLFRPEFLNRFDEMVVFRPLKKDELLLLVDMLLAQVNATLERQKVSVTLDEQSKQWLVEHGYDAKLGARPLRRTIQRTVENIIAKKLLEPSFVPGSVIAITVADLDQESS